jgi:hypothetical protein
MTVALLAIQAGGTVAFVALFLWPALLIPFRLLEERWIEGVKIAAVHLADLDAATVHGIEPMANALLKLGTRADRQLRLEIHAQDLAGAGNWDPLILGAAVAGTPVGSALEGTRLDDVARDAGRRAAHTLDDMLAPEAEEQAAGDASEKTTSERKKPRPHSARETLRQLRRINWRDFDTVLRDGRLDRQELAPLVERLRENPDLPLFASGAFPEGIHSSPTIRDRLLFIVENDADTAPPEKPVARPTPDSAETAGSSA